MEALQGTKGKNEPKPVAFLLFRAESSGITADHHLIYWNGALDNICEACDIIHLLEATDPK